LLRGRFSWLERHGLVGPEPSQSTPGWFFITRRGQQFINDDGALDRVRAEDRLSVDLHALIAERVRSQYLLGEMEAAAFLALRAVEIRVRELAAKSDSDIGVKLMKAAFGQDGALRDADLDAGEQDAMMALYWGAIGVFKNPSSHRQVDFDDPTLASEVILLADLLLRLLDRQDAR
jgi:uncharacterized protein (TIGR02391 family)